MKLKQPYKKYQHHKTGRMNGTERRYSMLLKAAVQAGEIERWEFERLNVRLADNTYFLADFYVVYSDHVEMHEIKGGLIRDDAIVKFKVAAETFPEFRWKMIQWKSKKEGWKVVKDI